MPSAPFFQSIYLPWSHLQTKILHVLFSMKIFQATSQFLILYTGTNESVHEPVCHLPADAPFLREQGWVGLLQPLGSATGKQMALRSPQSRLFQNLDGFGEKRANILNFECSICSFSDLLFTHVHQVLRQILNFTEGKAKNASFICLFYFFNNSYITLGLMQNPEILNHCSMDTYKY